MCREVRAGSLQCENYTGLWLGLQRRHLAWGSLIVVELYVWKELRTAEMFFSLCFGLRKFMHLEQLQSGA